MLEIGLEGDVTVLLRAWHGGDVHALDALMPLVYPVLRELAAGQLRRERLGHTLQPTALVNEAYLRLLNSQQVDWQDRIHFLAVSARLMRQVLVDHARSHARVKRGGGAGPIPLERVDPAAPMDLAEVLTVHIAPEELAMLDARKAHVVELRFFGGLTIEETAQELGISEESASRDWRLAKSWLLQHITENGDSV